MRVKLLKKERLLNDFFKVDAAELQFEKFDGSWSVPVRRLNLERGEAVAVLIYLKDKDSFVLIRQFRFAVYEAGRDGWIEEIVAGVLDKEGESPVECARRECIEEAGYAIEHFEPIGTIFVSPGITTERIHLFIGYCNSDDRKFAGGGLAAEHEDIQLVEWSRREALQKLLNNKIEDGKTVLALQHFFLKEYLKQK